MDEKKLVIHIKGHTVTADAIGFKGEACEKITEKLDEVMQQLNRDIKPERWENDVQNIQQH